MSSKSYFVAILFRARLLSEGEKSSVVLMLPTFCRNDRKVFTIIVVSLSVIPKSLILISASVDNCFTSHVTNFI